MRRIRLHSFDHERLDAWHLAVSLAQRAHRIVKAFPRGAGDLADQVRRSSTSAVLNIAEGANARTAEEKVHKFTVARSEAGEAAAAIQLAVVLGFVDSRMAQPALNDAQRVLGMTTGLIKKFGGLPPK